MWEGNGIKTLQDQILVAENIASTWLFTMEFLDNIIIRILILNKMIKLNPVSQNISLDIDFDSQSIKGLTSFKIDIEPS